MYGASAGALPLVRVADALADRLAEKHRLARRDVDDGVLAGDVGELVLVDAHARVACGLADGRIVDRDHVRKAAAGGVRRDDGRRRTDLAALFASHRVDADDWIALPEYGGASEDLADIGELSSAQRKLGSHRLEERIPLCGQLLSIRALTGSLARTQGQRTEAANDGEAWNRGGHALPARHGACRRAACGCIDPRAQATSHGRASGDLVELNQTRAIVGR